MSEPPFPRSLRGSPSTQRPTVTSIPVDSCVKPPSFHSSLLDQRHRDPPADLLKRRSKEMRGGLRQLMLLVSRIIVDVFHVQMPNVAVCPARIQITWTPLWRVPNWTLRLRLQDYGFVLITTNKLQHWVKTRFGCLTFIRLFSLCAVHQWWKVTKYIYSSTVHFMQLYTSTLLHFRGKYCISYSTICIWKLLVTFQILFINEKYNPLINYDVLL